jgi:hypothetical protein
MSDSQRHRYTVHFIMAARRTPGSPYSGRYHPRTLSKPGPRRRRVCHFVREDLDERLAVWCDKEDVSKSRVLEHLIEKHLAIEDPNSTCYVSEVPHIIIPRRQKKAQRLQALDPHANSRAYLADADLTPLERQQRFGSQASPPINHDNTYAVAGKSYVVNRSPSSYVPDYWEAANAKPI